MFKKAAYLTAIVALIGAGMANAFPAVAQNSTLDTSATTPLYPEGATISEWAAMMNGDDAFTMDEHYSTMMSDEQMRSQMAAMMAAMASDGEMGQYMTDVMGADHGTMMSGDLDHDFTGSMMDGFSRRGDAPQNRR